MTNKELVLDTLKRASKIIAQDLQSRAPDMTGTELIDEEAYLPDFIIAVTKKNMLDRPVGFVCKSSAGRAVKLIQPYDSTVYTAEPEELPAQWGFYWSTDPAKAKPFISIATSPYNTGDCCTYEGHTWQSNQEGNVWAPGTTGAKWTDLGVIEEVLS